jgi:hypothetical protein
VYAFDDTQKERSERVRTVSTLGEGKAEVAGNGTEVCRGERGTFDDTQKERSVAKAEREGERCASWMLTKRESLLDTRVAFGGEVRKYGEGEEGKKNMRREEEIDGV